MTYITVDILEPDSSQISLILSSESLTEVLPVLGNIVNPSVSPEENVSSVIKCTVICSTIAVDVGKDHMISLLAFGFLDQSCATDSLESRWLSCCTVAISLVDRQVCVTICVDVYKIVQTIRVHVNEVDPFWELAVEVGIQVTCLCELCFAISRVGPCPSKLA